MAYFYEENINANYNSNFPFYSTDTSYLHPYSEMYLILLPYAAQNKDYH
jgi:hypothetical protein